ncbi:MAG: peptidase, partial [Actinomycetes bacterium]
PDDSQPNAVGLVIAVGQLLGSSPLRPGQFSSPQPPGLVVLHPPAQTLSTVPDYEVASGCVLLPGMPHLGLDHRAAWAAADVRGTVTELHTRCGVNPAADADTAALAMLLAA